MSATGLVRVSSTAYVSILSVRSTVNVGHMVYKRFRSAQLAVYAAAYPENELYETLP
ncbi:hypothetical protein GCM10009000_030540 [Halobacterium noricense]